MLSDPMSECARWRPHRGWACRARSPTPTRRCRSDSSSTTSTPPRRWGIGTLPPHSTIPWRTPSGCRPRSRRWAVTNWATHWCSPPPWASAPSTSKASRSRPTAACRRSESYGSGYRARTTRRSRPKRRSTWPVSRRNSPRADGTALPTRRRSRHSRRSPPAGCPPHSSRCRPAAPTRPAASPARSSRAWTSPRPGTWTGRSCPCPIRYRSESSPWSSCSSPP